MDPIIQTASQNMVKAFHLLQTDLATVRTGRATAGLVDSLVVSVYGGTATMKIVELATVSVSDAQTLVIAPYDASIIGEIQKGIQEANIGLTPNNDGVVIRITIPPLSEERRKDLIHLMKQKLENGRILIRQARHDAMAEIKKDEELSEDELKRLEKEIQRLTDEYSEKIDALSKKKEEELMQI
jgi:ribosome recycling factor